MPTTESLPAASEPAPAVTPERKQSRLTQVAAWIAIAAGVVVIVAVVFGTGFCLGAHSDRGHRHHGGGFHGHHGMMQHHGGGHMRGGGPGMFQPPFGQWGPWHHGGPDQGSDQGPGPGNQPQQGPGDNPAKPPRP